MLEKTLYLTSLYLSANKVPLVVQVLAALLAASIVGLVAFPSKPLRIAVLAALQLPIYWIASELTTGEWFFILYKALGTLISALGGSIYNDGFTDTLVVYGLPGLAHGAIATAACLLVWRRITSGRGKRQPPRRR